MVATTQLYRIRPSGLSDVSSVTSMFLAALGPDQLMSMLFPNRDTYPNIYPTYIYRTCHTRWWTVGYVVDMAVDAKDGSPVGFATWRRPKSDLSFYERWISPFSWISSVMQGLIAMRDYFFPIPHIDEHASKAIYRVFHDIVEPEVLTTQRRRDAWYLCNIGVVPSVRGAGVGAMLLRHGLQRVDERGAAAWLVAVEGKDTFYEKFGFVEVAKANVGELKQWNGGAVMFRE